MGLTWYKARSVGGQITVDCNDHQSNGHIEQIALSVISGKSVSYQKDRIWASVPVSIWSINR